MASATCWGAESSDQRCRSQHRIRGETPAAAARRKPRRHHRRRFSRRTRSPNPLDQTWGRPPAIPIIDILSTTRGAPKVGRARSEKGRGHGGRALHCSIRVRERGSRKFLESGQVQSSSPKLGRIRVDFGREMCPRPVEVGRMSASGARIGDNFDAKGSAVVQNARRLAARRAAHGRGLPIWRTATRVRGPVPDSGSGSRGVHTRRRRIKNSKGKEKNQTHDEHQKHTKNNDKNNNSKHNNNKQK